MVFPPSGRLAVMMFTVYADDLFEDVRVWAEDTMLLVRLYRTICGDVSGGTQASCLLGSFTSFLPASLSESCSRAGRRL